MKKLLFAIAGAVAFAAMATDYDVLSFETFDLNTYPDGVVANKLDTGAEGTPYRWVCNGDDASAVKAYDAEFQAPDITGPAQITGTNAKYLNLDTNGSELKRRINDDGSAQTVGDALYIDTLVQFTPSESAPTSTDLDGAKLAIWLGVDSEHNTTNLMVQGNYWDVSEGFFGTSQAFALTGKTIEPNTWYRLTVKAIPNILGSDYSMPAFQIKVDGTEMILATSPFSSGILELISSAYASEDIAAAVAANKLVPSIQAEPGNYGDTATLTSVGFKGTGALDNFVVTTDDPFPAAATIDFTLTWPQGVTPVSYTIDDGEAVTIDGNTTFPIQVADGAVVAFTFTNADGVTKTMSATASSSVDEIDASTATYVWADYLGDAVAGAYTIDNLADLILFQKGVAAGLATASTTFKLTADVTLDAPWPGIGLQNGKDIWDQTSFNEGAFCGTFDGQNNTISGFQMVGVAGNPKNNDEGLDYCGFFNSIYGATIKDLKIQYAGALFAADTTSSTKESGATFVGVAKESTLLNLTSLQKDSSTAVSCSKGFGGIVGFVTSGTTVESCTNNVNMTSLASNKAGGIAMIVQGGTGMATIRNCENNGTTAGNNTQKGGIVGYVGTDGSLTIDSCTDTAGSEPTFYCWNKGTVTVSGVNKAPASVVPCKNQSNGNARAVNGLTFATVDGSVATFVADNALALNGEYKVMATGATATFAFAEAGTIAFDTALFTPTFAITAPGLKLTDATSGTVKTYTAAALATPTVTVNGGANATATWTVNGEPAASAPATLTEGETYAVFYTANQGYHFEENAVTNASGTAGTENITIVITDAVADQAAGWVDDSTTVSNETASAAYPDLAGTALADANAGELTDWAKANSVDFTAVTTAPADYVEAFLLDCEPTPAAVAKEKEEFVLDISFDSEGNPVVSTPDGKTYNGKLQLKGKANLNDASWTNLDAPTSGYKFYMYELSL